VGAHGNDGRRVVMVLMAFNGRGGKRKPRARIRVASCCPLGCTSADFTLASQTDAIRVRRVIGSTSSHRTVGFLAQAQVVDVPFLKLFRYKQRNLFH
jgi:hypothetical protein